MNRQALLTTVVAAGCGIGALGSLATTADLTAFLINPPPPPKLSSPLNTGKLAWLAGLYVLAAGVLAASAWLVSRPDSTQQRVVSGWSPVAVTLWFLIGGYLLLVYYPLPPHLHHLDKLLFLIGGVVLWGLWFTWFPRSMSRVLASRFYAYVRVGLINVLVFVAVGEVVMRLADPVLADNGLFGGTYSPSGLTPHKEVGGSIRWTNSHGFRDRERMLEKPAAARRVVVLGDSFVWGVGVTYDQTFTTLLEHSIQATRPGAEIINLGVPGNQPDFELDLLKDFGIHLHPDVVIVNLFIGNDIIPKRGAEREARIIVAGLDYHVHFNGNWVHDHWGLDRWHLYHNLNHLFRVDLAPLRRFFRGQATKMAKAVIPRPSSLPVSWEFDYLKWIEDRYDLFLKADTALFSYHWRQTEDIMEEFYDFLHRRGIPLLVVLIPDQAQLDRMMQEQFMETMAIAPQEFEFDKPQRYLRKWCGRRNVPCIDLLSVWRKDYERGTFYLPADVHWSASGHEQAATILLPILEELLAGREPAPRS